MTELTATPTHVIGTSTHLAFTDENGNDVLPGGRYYDTATYEANPDAILAVVFDEISKRIPAPEAELPAAVTPIKIKEADVQPKLDQIEAAKLALAEVAVL